MAIFATAAFAVNDKTKGKGKGIVKKCAKTQKKTMEDATCTIAATETISFGEGNSITITCKKTAPTCAAAAQQANDYVYTLMVLIINSHIS